MRIKMFFFLLVNLLFLGSKAQLQSVYFPIELEQKIITNFPAVHSFCWAQYDGKWIIMSGRTNGLHGFQPPFAFPLADQNEMIYIVDPLNETVVSSSLSSLPVEVAEQVSASNLQFSQTDDKLILVGGYGYSTINTAYITFPSMLWIDLPGLIEAIESNEPLGSHFKRYENEVLAVCGGDLGLINGTFYLVFGHRFDGRYNPFNGGSYTQTYTDEIRFFNIEETEESIQMVNYDAWWDPEHFHRRDYNLIARVNADGTKGYNGFTGVFQRNANLPHKTSIVFNENDYQVDSSFTQLLNQYHTAHLPMYSEQDSTMSTMFFGGIGEYYINEAGELIQDSLVPFTKTISMVHQTPQTTFESWLQVEMTSFLGASAEFIPDLSAPFDDRNILQLDDLPVGRIHIGSIVGGIESDSRNTFMQATGSTVASNKIIDVFINSEVLSNKAKAISNQYNVKQSLEGITVASDLDVKDLNILILDSSGKTVFKSKPQLKNNQVFIPYSELNGMKGVGVCQVVGQGVIQNFKLIIP